MAKNTIIRRKQVAKEMGICTSQTHVHEAKGLIPEFINIGARARGLPVREVDIVNAARIAGKSDEEIKLIVKQLMQQRKNICVGAA